MNKGLGQRFRFRPQTLHLIADSNLRSRRGKLLGNRPGDTALVCQAEYHGRLTL